MVTHIIATKQLDPMIILKFYLATAILGLKCFEPGTAIRRQVDGQSIHAIDIPVTEESKGLFKC